MPSKYSHSAVLAQYSSRGMISLPNDQHLTYMNSATAIGYTPVIARSRAQSLKSQSSNPADSQKSLRSQVSHDRLPARSHQHFNNKNSNAPRRFIPDSDSEGELEHSQVNGRPIPPRSDSLAPPHKTSAPRSRPESKIRPARGAAGKGAHPNQESMEPKSLPSIPSNLKSAARKDRVGNAAAAQKEEKKATQLPNVKSDPPRNLPISSPQAVSGTRIQSVRNRNAIYMASTPMTDPLPSKVEFDEFLDATEPDFVHHLHVAGPQSSTAARAHISRIMASSYERQSLDTNQLDRGIIAPFQHSQESRLNSLSTLSALGEQGTEFGKPSVIRTPKIAHSKRDSGAIVMNNSTIINHDTTPVARTNSLLRRTSNRVAPALKIIRPSSAAANYDDKAHALTVNGFLGSSITFGHDGIDGTNPNIEHVRASMEEPHAIACPPDISKYKMRSGIETPLAQVGEILLMEQSLSIARREEKIQEAEQRLWALKHTAHSGTKGGKYGQGHKSEAALAAAAEAAEAKLTNGGFFKRLRAKSRARK